MLVYVSIAIIFFAVLLLSEAGRSFLQRTVALVVTGGLLFLCAWIIGGDAVLENGFVRLIAGVLALVAAAGGIFVALRSIVKFAIFYSRQFFAKIKIEKKPKKEIARPLKIKPKSKPRTEVAEEIKTEIAVVKKNNLKRPVSWKWNEIKEFIKSEISGNKEGTIKVTEWSRKNVNVEVNTDKYRPYKILAVLALNLILLVAFLSMIIGLLMLKL